MRASLMKINGQQQSNTSKFLLGSTARVMSPFVYRAEGQRFNPSLRSLTLDGFGVLLDLTVGSATDHIPHYDLPRGISGSQPQTVGRAQVVVIVFPGPFHLPNTEHMLSVWQSLWKHCKTSTACHLCKESKQQKLMETTFSFYLHNR